MKSKITHGDRLHASELRLDDASNGKRLPVEPALLSHVPFAWRASVVEWHRLRPQELAEHYVDGHGLAVSTGDRPISFGWKDGASRRSPNHAKITERDYVFTRYSK